MVKRCAGAFFIGLFAGVCAVFVPRLGALFSGDLSGVPIFPAPFVALGLFYGAIVGGVVAIVYATKVGAPIDQFMTGLGVPALLAGALATTAHTEHVKDVSTAAAMSSAIRIDNTPTSIESLSPTRDKVSFEMLLGIGAAYAGDPTAPSEPASKWTPSLSTLQVPEPNYAIVLQSSPNADAAQKSAAKLRVMFPTATAVKTDRGFDVITGVKPRSSAVLEAIEIKGKSGIDPILVREK